jgi:hypothetical protein
MEYESKIRAKLEESSDDELSDEEEQIAAIEKS